MRFYNSEFDKMHGDLQKSLQIIRKKRNFDASSYVDKKVSLINRYLSNFGLSTCVVGVSGGIDSAIVLGILAKASIQIDSPIKRIIAVMMPVYKTEGATNQDKAMERGVEVAQKFGIKPIIVDLTKSHTEIKNVVDTSLREEGRAWAAGQLVSTARTPVLYYITSLMTQSDMPGLVCGTTNRDEGSYLGYVGKASDGMVDIQIISDLHKSEVYQVAEKVGAPESVMKVTPSGDMHDGRTDEQVFGAPYDFVELYLNYLNLSDKEKVALTANYSSEAKEQFEELKNHIEALHKYNGHKYLIGSPAVHLDIYESAVTGGWIDNRKLVEERSGFKF